MGFWSNEEDGYDPTPRENLEKCGSYEMGIVARLETPEYKIRLAMDLLKRALEEIEAEKKGK